MFPVFRQENHPLAAPQSAGRVEFNVSQSRGIALLPFSCRNGYSFVDVEQLRENFDHEAIARRFFSEKVAATCRLAPSKRYQAFFRFWTPKIVYQGTGNRASASPVLRFLETGGRKWHWFRLVPRVPKQRTGPCRKCGPAMATSPLCAFEDMDGGWKAQDLAAATLVTPSEVEQAGACTQGVSEKIALFCAIFCTPEASKTRSTPRNSRFTSYAYQLTVQLLKPLRHGTCVEYGVNFFSCRLGLIWVTGLWSLV